MVDECPSDEVWHQFVSRAEVAEDKDCSLPADVQEALRKNPDAAWDVEEAEFIEDASLSEDSPGSGDDTEPPLR